MWKRQAEPAAMWKFPFECFMSGGFPFTIELTTNKAAPAGQRPAAESRAKAGMITIQYGMHIFFEYQAFILDMLTAATSYREHLEGSFCLFFVFF